MDTNHEDWLLNTSKSQVDNDIYSARSWLLTAKSIFPQSFRLQFEEYLLEMKKENFEECARVLNEIYRDFSSESQLWEEIELLIQSNEKSNDASRNDIFSHLPGITQQRMIIASAEVRVNITQYCRLMMLLMTKFPETVSQYGLPITEKLVETEKRDAELTPVNHCRKLLVREVLPVICRSSSLSVSNKHIYKWLQKATEFYSCFFTLKEAESDGCESWKEMETLLSTIAVRCDWSIDNSDTKSSSLSDRMSFMRDLFRQSRTDVDGAVNRKQIFYTTIILLFEAASKYMLAMDPAIYTNSDSTDKAYVHIADVSETGESPNSQLTTNSRSADIRETFHVAREAWTILHSLESYEKDFNHLTRRWKCERWTWFQLFLADVLAYNANHKAALSRLDLLEQKSDEAGFHKALVARIHCQLASTYFALDQLNESCEHIFRALAHLPYSPAPDAQYPTRLLPPVNPPDSELFTRGSAAPPQARLRTVALAIKELLPFWVHVFITNLQRVTLAVEDDQVLGHMIILTQHDWPRWKTQASRVLRRVVEKRSFKFHLFFDYVINIDLLEEFAFIRNEGSCKLSLRPNETERHHVTRGVNREADEDFWGAMKRNVARSRSGADDLMHAYLSECRESLTSCLNLVEPR